MHKNYEQRLKQLRDSGSHLLLKDNLTGLEKESLRVSPQGNISQHKHPEKLGSALTHPWITTDYSEALLEFITPPLGLAEQALDFLLDIETFVYHQLDDELLWTSSMPCIIRGEEDIRIAEYGSSNLGKMKSVYRHGLAWRYGKMMQVIAGVHFNHSFAAAFWPAYQQMMGYQGSLRRFVDDAYMGLTRNLQRNGWLIYYLFGSSPAICKTFLSGIPTPENMKELHRNTFYEPYGTSLRMGDIGYTNRMEDKVGIKANYDTLAGYTKSLRCAINTPCKQYKKIGVKVDGEYRQLNANRLQIENEYYSTVRPKQILEAMEKPVDALDARGIRYIELRSLDINVWHPVGLTRQQLHFVEVFLLYCLLDDSPLIDGEEQKEIDHNQSRVAHLGRKPGLALSRSGKNVGLRSWAEELFTLMRPVAELLDSAHASMDFTSALQEYAEWLQFPDMTPSARIVQELFDKQESYYEFARRKSLEHRQLFLKRELTQAKTMAFQEQADVSIARQKQIEAGDTMDFDTFLTHYFSDK